MASTTILDVDGTLVDTNYQHALAWYRAFRQHGILLPVWRVHRHIGMGGDHMIEALCGEEVERGQGDDIRSAEKPLYLSLIHEVEPFDGAKDLIRDLKDRGHAVILASSAKPDEMDHYIELLDAGELADRWTTSADVEATKPDPDLVGTALEKAEAPAEEAVLVGDSTYDLEAAKRAGVEAIAVLTGGYSDQELRDAGAAQVFGSIQELRTSLDDTALAGS